MKPTADTAERARVTAEQRAELRARAESERDVGRHPHSLGIPLLALLDDYERLLAAEEHHLRLFGGVREVLLMLECGVRNAAPGSVRGDEAVDALVGSPMQTLLMDVLLKRLDERRVERALDRQRDGGGRPMDR